MKAEKLGEVQLWSARLQLARGAHTASSLQRVVTEYVEKSGRVVVGYFDEDDATYTMLLWPEDREGFKQQTVEMSDESADELAVILGASRVEKGVIGPDAIHCMMGLKVDGYDDGRIASLNEIAEHTKNLSTKLAHMVSARMTDEGVESYGEPVVVLTGALDQVDAIHSIGHALKQHHYAIEHGSDSVTRFYETDWANVSDAD